MSRLDDELRIAFRRQTPPDGLADRVLEAIAQQPAPRPGWWRRLAALLEPPRMRWVAIGVTASLLIAIGAAQLNKRQVVVNDDRKVASNESPTPTPSTESVVPAKSEVKTQAPSLSNRKAQVASPVKRQLALARLRKEKELNAQAAAAKDKLMLALHIASATLNDAQKAIHDDGPKPARTQ